MQDQAIKLSRRPALDGLRGVAIAVVVLYHFKTRSLFPGGSFGVDLFFALSGFLITSLLITEWQARGTFSLPRFYMRRVLRLMPAFVAFVCIYTAFVILTHPATETGNLAPRDALENAGWAFTYLYSWAVANDSVVPGGYMPLWSLSVEEQFYLVWPVLLWLLLVPGRVRPSIVMLLTVALFTLSAVVPVLRSWGHDDMDLLRAYFGADFRAHCLLAGCVPGIAVTTSMFRQEHARSLVFRVILAAATAILVFLLFKTTPERLAVDYKWSLPLISISSAIVVTGGAFVDGGVGLTLFGNRVMTYLGARSYAIYLWHYPVSQTIATLLPIPHLVIAGMATLVLAELSYRLVERPALSLRDRIWRPRRVVHVDPEPALATVQQAA